MRYVEAFSSSQLVSFRIINNMILIYNRLSTTNKLTHQLIFVFVTDSFKGFILFNVYFLAKKIRTPLQSLFWDSTSALPVHHQVYSGCVCYRCVLV